MRHMKAFRKGNSQREFHQRFASQSAMEYLMTYGWAILIIAVVLAALFELGVFNPMTFAPKASPGSCQVVRPEGAGTTNFISIEGECNGELPQYAASINFSDSYIFTSSNVVSNQNLMSSGYTMTIWFYEPNSASSVNVGCPTSPILQITNTATYFPWIGMEAQCGPYTNPSTIICISNQGGTCSNNIGTSGGGFAPNTWYFLSATYTPGNSLKSYENGQLIANRSISQTFNSLSYGQVCMGGCMGGGGVGAPFKIANVQIYNTPLSSNDVKALYQEGIGGAPIKIQNLIGWWPLNGNANDYSGNGNNGVPTNVIYTSNWYSGYSAP